jgi:hypothetical protein
MMSNAPTDGCQPVSRNSIGVLEWRPALVVRGPFPSRAPGRVSPRGAGSAPDDICPYTLSECVRPASR